MKNVVYLSIVLFLVVLLIGCNTKKDVESKEYSNVKYNQKESSVLSKSVIEVNNEDYNELRKVQIQSAIATYIAESGDIVIYGLGNDVDTILRNLQLGVRYEECGYGPYLEIKTNYNPKGDNYNGWDIAIKENGEVTVDVSKKDMFTTYNQSYDTQSKIEVPHSSDILKEKESDILHEKKNVTEEVDLGKLNIFLSNFAEVYFEQYDEYNIDYEQVIFFGIWHNFINNYSAFQAGNPSGLKIRESYVEETVKKYLNINVEHQSISFKGCKWLYKDNYYYGIGATGPLEFVKIKKVYEIEKDLFEIEGLQCCLLDTSETADIIAKIVAKVKWLEDRYILVSYNKV